MKKRPEGADAREPAGASKLFLLGRKLRDMAKEYDREMRKLRALKEKGGPDTDGPDREAS